MTRDFLREKKFWNAANASGERNRLNQRLRAERGSESEDRVHLT
jgi:hypothetical protein